MCALDPASEVRLFAPPLSSTESSPPFKSSRLQPQCLAIGDVMAALPNHSLGEDKMQLAVDQLTCCIKVTGVGDGLRHDVEHDLTEAVEPPGAEEVGPPRRYCIKGATGDNPIGMLDIGPVPVKHFLDGLLVAHVPGVVRRGEYTLDCDLIPSCDRWNQERSTSSERWFTKPMQLQAEGRTRRRRSLDARPSTASRTCSRCRFSAPRSTRCSADGSDGMTDAPSDLALDLLDHTSGFLGDRAPSDQA